MDVPLPSRPRRPGKCNRHVRLARVARVAVSLTLLSSTDLGTGLHGADALGLEDDLVTDISPAEDAEPGDEWARLTKEDWQPGRTDNFSTSVPVKDLECEGPQTRIQTIPGLSWVDVKEVMHQRPSNIRQDPGLFSAIMQIQQKESDNCVLGIASTSALLLPVSMPKFRNLARVLSSDQNFLVLNVTFYDTLRSGFPMFGILDDIATEEYRSWFDSAESRQFFAALPEPKACQGPKAMALQRRILSLRKQRQEEVSGGIDLVLPAVDLFAAGEASGSAGGSTGCRPAAAAALLAMALSRAEAVTAVGDRDAAGSGLEVYAAALRDVIELTARAEELIRDYSWDEGVAFGQLVATPWNLWYMLQQIQFALQRLLGSPWKLPRPVDDGPQSFVHEIGADPNTHVDVADTVEVMLRQHAEVSRRLHSDGSRLMRHWQECRQGYDIAASKYAQACGEAEDEAKQCDANASTQPSEWKRMAERTVTASRHAVAAERDFNKALQRLNTSVDVQERQMSLVLNALQDMEEKRALSLRDAFMKIAVFDTSWLRNVQYDLDSAVQAIEQRDAVEELQDFIREHRSQAPPPCRQIARPHWEIATGSGRRPRQDVQALTVATASAADQAEAMRPILRSVLNSRADASGTGADCGSIDASCSSTFPSEEQLADLGSLLFGEAAAAIAPATASTSGPPSEGPLSRTAMAAASRAGFCAALHTELQASASAAAAAWAAEDPSAEMGGLPPPAAKLDPAAFEAAVGLFKAALDGCDRDSDAWNGRDLLVLSKLLQSESEDGKPIDILLRVYNHPLWSRVTFWEDALLVGLAEAHTRLVLARWSSDAQSSSSSAKGEAQEVVMTTFLQRYMGYMVALGIKLEQARSCAERTLRKQAPLLGASCEVYVRLITHSGGRDEPDGTASLRGATHGKAGPNIGGPVVAGGVDEAGSDASKAQSFGCRWDVLRLLLALQCSVLRVFQKRLGHNYKKVHVAYELHRSRVLVQYCRQTLL
ncbi:unnamed protein product [Polarella glacialis]|uniref:Uncharacterized protein n=1 Tax=Polarella glacialis TaxID=89957 RepID=A0A813JHV3_POLGL|nr:unnamed protein product [Polarella glacialis]